MFLLLRVRADLDMVQRSVPQAIIVVPTRELGVQHVMLTWRLLGGNISRRNPGDRANMFSYTGPRGVIVRGMFDANDARRAATEGYLEGCTVVVGTPAALGRAIASGALPLLRVDHFVVDEADACLPTLQDLSQAQKLLAAAPKTEMYVPTPDEEDDDDSTSILGAATPSPSPAAAPYDDAEAVSQNDREAEDGQPQAVPLEAVEALHLWTAPKTAPMRWHSFIVGATLDDSCLAVAREAGLVPDPVQVAVSGPLSIPAGVTHRLLVLPPPVQGGPPASRLALAALCRLIRADLAIEGCGPDEPPARAWVFASDEASARDAAEPLRSALWGTHTLAVLLPGGEAPTRAATTFRDGGASLLLATPDVERGLDMPAVRFVYSLSPPKNATSYMHRAGRVGRVGALKGATVTTLCMQEQLPHMQAMAQELGVQLQVIDSQPAGEAAPEGDRVALVQKLEDLLHLLS
jgi:superfamily II DNA/RNA helicase